MSCQFLLQTCPAKPIVFISGSLSLQQWTLLKFNKEKVLPLTYQDDGFNITHGERNFIRSTVPLCIKQNIHKSYLLHFSLCISGLRCSFITSSKRTWSLDFIPVKLCMNSMDGKKSPVLNPPSIFWNPCRS